MPTALDNFITIARNQANGLGHTMGPFRRFRTRTHARSVCLRCGMSLTVNTERGAPMDGRALTYRCEFGEDQLDERTDPRGPGSAPSRTAASAGSGAVVC